MNAKEQDYLERLYLENYSDMECYAAHVLSNRDLAMDLVQEAFLVAQKKIKILMLHPSPRAWLFTTLKNLVGNTYRQQKKMQAMVEIQPEDGAVLLEPSLLATYQGLVPDEELELLILVYSLGWPYEYVARRKGISLVACKKRIQRARAHFQAAYRAQNL